jgi:hypothetical protein
VSGWLGPPAPWEFIGRAWHRHLAWRLRETGSINRTESIIWLLVCGFFAVALVMTVAGR